ncbi:MAG: flap endonuclease [Gammaproteobacteria bacterium]|nr:flap endonuclease [Gammaproteobacteria bacterium]NIR83179.1 flap endonuclease [Gammaproteobacteria bacterium]NIR90987.1 flap endonuclease [Gammaproteobacteria bacterium]NIU04344.1 flap endonuclease [Gammaproteobacteria bacterium]NIV52567.1 flap endonuclease [Gammaproteobacteria bacterium]
MNVHLLDGTYELFRYFAAVPSRRDREGEEIGAVRGVVDSVRKLIIEGGVTHLGVATDHVVESFRNDLWSGYKSSEGIEPELLDQFPILEQALQALGVVVWPMVEFEADDALAAAAAVAAPDDRVERVFICTPDKDLAQCVRGNRVVLLDRRKERILDERGVWEKFGVAPASIPDWLALVGDQADGFPGLPGFGAQSAAILLARYSHLESIPGDPAQWDVKVRGAPRLAYTLRERWDQALLFRKLATLRTDAISVENVDTLAWHGPTRDIGWWAKRLSLPGLAGT